MHLSRLAHEIETHLAWNMYEYEAWQHAPRSDMQVSPEWFQALNARIAGVERETAA